MAFEELREKIINDAKEKATEIVKEAELESSKIIEKAKEEQDNLLNQIKKEGYHKAEERYQNIVTLAKVSGRNMVLKVRQEILDEVFKNAHERLKKLSKDQFRKLAMNLLVNTPPKEITKVLVGKKNTKMIDKSFIDKVNRALKGKADGKFILSKSDRDFEYGLYLVTDWIEIDFTFNGILRSTREKIEMEVINTLFGKG